MQRVGSPSRSRQQLGASGAACESSGPAGEALGGNGAAGGVKRGLGGAHRTLVEEMSMTGAQFLDFAVRTPREATLNGDQDDRGGPGVGGVKAKLGLFDMCHVVRQCRWCRGRNRTTTHKNQPTMSRCIHHRIENKA